MSDPFANLPKGERFLKDRVVLHCGDCLKVLDGLAENSIDACVTDPPYHLTSIVQRFGKPNSAPVRVPDINAVNCIKAAHARAAAGFMGKVWDGGDIAFRPDVWRKVFRVLKPGAHLVAFGGTRTYHRMACAIEDAGFEVRDTIMWVYGSGFPKSHDVSKGIDRAAGEERELLRVVERTGKEAGTYGAFAGPSPVTAPATDAARQWDGWGTALKPANEPVVLCTKPLQVVEHLTILLAETTARLMLWLDCNASDAAKDLNASLVRLQGAVGSVLDGAKIKSLESIGIAPYAAAAFTFSEPALLDQIKTKASFALSHVKQSGRADSALGQTIPNGAVADISNQIPDMCMSVMSGDTSGNTVSSWLKISDAILSHGSTFTTEMALRLTIALRTLNSCLAPIISNGTGDLSPNVEPIVLARKPLSEGTVAANVLRWNVGAINVDGCRVATDTPRPHIERRNDKSLDGDIYGSGINGSRHLGETTSARWPANVVHDGSDEVVAAFPDAPGQQRYTGPEYGNKLSVNVYGDYGPISAAEPRGDSGSAARFFYTAKADAMDRLGSKHPTVKPLDLMQWLVRLVTPKGGMVLDPFAGTGTTAEVAWREGMAAVLIEAEAEYQADIRRRMALVLAGPDERQRESIKAKNLPRDDGPLFAPRDEYDGQRDGRDSYYEGLRAIRERKAAGGPGWEPK